MQDEPTVDVHVGRESMVLHASGPTALWRSSCCFWATKTVKGTAAAITKMTKIPVVLEAVGENINLKAFFIEAISNSRVEEIEAFVNSKN